MENILKIINSIKANNGEALLKEISYEMHLQNDIGFTSLDLAEFTVKIEKEFGVDIYEDGMVYTVNDVINKIKK